MTGSAVNEIKARLFSVVSSQPTISLLEKKMAFTFYFTPIDVSHWRLWQQEWKVSTSKSAHTQPSRSVSTLTFTNTVIHTVVFSVWQNYTVKKPCLYAKRAHTQTRNKWIIVFTSIFYFNRLKGLINIWWWWSRAFRSPTGPNTETQMDECLVCPLWATVEIRDCGLAGCVSSV